MGIDGETLKTVNEEGGKAPAFLIGIQDADCSHASAMEYLDELRELVNTLEIPVAGERIVSVKQVNPKFYVGSGKIQELKAEAQSLGASILIFDCELGPSQQRNIEKECSMKVFDRQEVILDIFAARASTSCLGVSAWTAFSSKSLAQTVKSLVYSSSSWRRRGLPEAKISSIVASSPVLQFLIYLPVEPKPPSPRAVSPSSCTGRNAAVYTGAMQSCATRSPGWMV